jgi:hypothetical protein
MHADMVICCVGKHPVGELVCDLGCTACCLACTECASRHVQERLRPDHIPDPLVDPAATFKAGQAVLYKAREGTYQPAVVALVDASVQPASYAVRLEGAAADALRFTEAERLMPAEQGLQHLHQGEGLVAAAALLLLLYLQNMLPKRGS